MADDKKFKKLSEDTWQEVEEIKTDWDWIEWDKGVEVVGYWLGAMVAGNGDDKWRIGLVEKSEHDEDELHLCAFSMPARLERKLKRVEKEHGYGVLIKIVNLGKTTIDTGKRKVKAWDFKVLVNPKIKLDEDKVIKAREGREVVPLEVSLESVEKVEKTKNDDFEE